MLDAVKRVCVGAICWGLFIAYMILVMNEPIYTALIAIPIFLGMCYVLGNEVINSLTDKKR